VSDLFSKLGIDWKLLIIQVINFSVLAIVLTKFLYKPIIKTLENRRQRIINDEKKSVELTEKIAEIERQKERVMADARKQSEILLKKAEQSAESVKEKMLADATIEMNKLRQTALKQIDEEKEKMTQSLKKELGVLISLSVEKSFSDIMDAKLQAKLVEEAVKKIPR
jgi:F-type H+-transporting ATPase subunit b